MYYTSLMFLLTKDALTLIINTKSMEELIVRHSVTKRSLYVSLHSYIVTEVYTGYYEAYSIQQWHYIHQTASVCDFVPWILISRLCSSQNYAFKCMKKKLYSHFPRIFSGFLGDCTVLKLGLGFDFNADKRFRFSMI